MNIVKHHEERKTFPDESFISCLCCIPRAWTLFANDQWTRIFESHDEGLKLIKEFRKDKIISFSEPISLMEKISAWLDEAIWDDRFDHLIVVAPSPTLSKVNNALSPAVLARTIAEVDWPTMTIPMCAGIKQTKIFRSPCDRNQ